VSVLNSKTTQNTNNSPEAVFKFHIRQVLAPN